MSVEILYMLFFTASLHVRTVQPSLKAGLKAGRIILLPSEEIITALTTLQASNGHLRLEDHERFPMVGAFLHLVRQVFMRSYPEYAFWCLLIPCYHPCQANVALQSRHLNKKDFRPQQNVFTHCTLQSSSILCHHPCF